ncbi:hypothetical protein P3S67_029858 [Capsicum chacoense]
MGGDFKMLEMEIIYQGDNSMHVRHNSSYDEFVASIMQSGDLDCAPSDVVISYAMHSREKVNPTIINSDVRVLTYIMDADADGFRPILRINVVERFFKGPLNSSAPPPQCPAVDDDLINDDLNDYENDVNDTINMEDYSIHMEYFSSDSQDDEEDRDGITSRTLLHRQNQFLLWSNIRR